MNRYMIQQNNGRYYIVDTASGDNDVVVCVDPNQIYADPSELAAEICAAMNTCKVMD